METKPKGGYGGHAGTTWQVMCARDKYVDGTLGSFKHPVQLNVINCSVRLSVRTPPFHGGKEGFDSPTEYHCTVRSVG